MKTITTLLRGLKTTAFQYLLVFSILFGGLASPIFAGTKNVTYSGTVCAGGVLTLTDVINSPSVGMPGPQRAAGVWFSVSPTDIVFSNLTDPNAVILSGLVGATSIIRWTSSTGQVYNITLNVSVIAPVKPSLLADGQSNLVLCAAKAVAFTSTAGFSKYQYSIPSINASLITAGATYTTVNTYYPNNESVYVIATALNGCQSSSDIVTVSSTVSLSIKNNTSACDASVIGKVLEVKPFDTNFTYAWTVPPPSFGPTNGANYTINNQGQYYVTATKVGCPPVVSNKVNISTTGLTPTPTISGSISICGTSGSVLLTSGSAAPLTNLYWYKDGTLDATANNALTYTAPGAGSYKIVRKEINNELCYVTSADHVITPTVVDQAITVTQNCNTASINYSFTGGIAPYTLALSSPTVVSYPGLPIAGSALYPLTSAGATTITVSSVTDATGCASDVSTLPPPFAPLTYYPAITPYTVTGGTVCAGGSITIGLTGSENGVTYNLYESSAPGAIIRTYPSLGSGAFNFNPPLSPAAAGTYLVTATRAASCPTVSMTGSATVVPSISAFNMTGPAGTLCSNAGPHAFGVSAPAPQAGVTYTLTNTATNVAIESNTTGSFLAISTPGTYKVVASNGGVCAPVTTINSFTINQAPTQYSVTGGPGCSNTVGGITIGLSGAAVGGVDYTLTNTTTAATLTLTGASNFTNITTPGVYSMSAIGAGCTTTMSGDARVSQQPITQTMATTGSVCPSGIISLVASEADVNYQVYFKPEGSLITSPYGAAFPGTTFGPVSTPGVYTVVANNLTTGCSSPVTGSLTVLAPPANKPVVASSLYYCSGGVTITLQSSESGVNYQLKNGAVNVGIPIPGNTGSDLQWNNVLQGAYTIEATKLGGCPVTMNGGTQLIITATTPPTAVFGTPSAIAKCANDPTPVTIPITFSGNAPFNCTITDAGGRVIGAPIVNEFQNAINFVVTPLSTTTYKIINLSDAGCSTVAGANTVTVTINPNRPINITTNLPIPICAGTPLTISADITVPATYTWSVGATGLGIAPSITVSPTTPTTYTVQAWDPATNCVSVSNTLVTVNDLPVITFIPPKTVFCQDDGQVDFVVPGVSPTPIGGTFSGVGITAPGGSTFSPALANPANVGTIITPITYSVAQNGCSNSSVQMITVNPTPNVNITGIGGTYCSNNAPVNFTLSPSQNPNINGTLSVVGFAATPAWLTSTNGGSSGTVNIAGLYALSGDGIYKLRYSYTNPTTGCAAFKDAPFTVRPDMSSTNFSITIPTLSGTPCQTDANPYPIVVRLAGNIVTDGVVLSSPDPGITSVGVAPNVQWFFTPSLAGNGTHTINLNYTDPSSPCTGTASTTVSVGAVLTIPGYAPIYCQADVAFDIWGEVNGTPKGGGKVELFKGTPILPALPALATDADDSDGAPYVNFSPGATFTGYGAGFYFIKYTYTDLSGCSNIRTFQFELVGTPDATFDTDFGGTLGVTNFCLSVTNVDLKPVSSVWNFTAPNGSVVGKKFNPSLAGINPHIIIRNTVTTKTCTAFYDMDVAVNPLPNYSITTLNAQYCDNEANNFIAINGAVNGVPRPDSKYVSSPNGLGTHFLVSDEIGGDGIVEIQPKVVGVSTYTVTFSDKDPVSGCSNSVSQSTKVVQSDPVNVGGFNSKAEYCKGDAAFPITASFVTTGLPVGAGGTFTASDVLDSQWLTGLPNTGVAKIDPSLASVGTHDITFTYVNSNTCTTSVVKSFTILDNPTVYNVGGGGNYCTLGGTGLPITLSGSQGALYTYELLLNGARIGAAPGVTMLGTGAPLVFPLQTAIGTYTITSTNSVTKCVSVMNGIATVVQNNPDFNTTLTPIKCKNGTGAIQINVVTPAPGYGASPPYQYSMNGGPWVGGSNIFTPLTANTYAFRVRDALNCTTVSKNVTLTEPLLGLTATNTLSPLVGCNIAPYEGGTTLTISGGTAFSNLGIYPDGYDIKWYDSSNNPITAFENKKTISGRNVGTYRYDVLDAGSCTVTGSFDVDPKPALTLIIDPDVTKHINNNCYNGSAGQFAVIASGGSGKYQFSLDGVNWFPAGGTPAVVFPATYTYTFINLEGAVAGKSYIAKVRDYDSPRCDAQAPAVSIFSPDALKLTGDVTNAITCYNAANGEITLTATGGKSGTYNYKLDAASAFQGGTNVYSGLAPGTYNIAVQDAAYTTCSPVYLTTPITLTNPPQISAVASVVKNVKCFGGSDGEVTVSTNGGTGTLSYNWYNVATPATSVSDTITAIGLIAGTYSVKITDAKLCNFTSNTVVVTEPTAIVTSFPVIIPAACNVATEGGSVTVNATGGTAPYTQKWSTLETGSTISNLLPGNYGVVVTDDNLCTASNSVNIGMLAPVAVAEDVTAGKHVDVLCNGAATGKFVVVGSGGSGDYEFSIDNINWAPDVAKIYTFKDLLADTYEVFIRDRNHPLCVSPTGLSVTINEPLALGLDTVSTSDATCNGVSDGIITVQGTGGSGAYQYALDGGGYAIANSWSNLAAGTHTVWVRDGVSTCEFKGMAGVVISQPLAVSFTTSSINPTCNGALDGTITVTAVGGSGLANMLYSNDNGANYQVPKVFSGLSGGVPYPIVVRDKSSLATCATLPQSITLNNPPLITATEALPSHINVACFGAATGSFTVVPVPASASLEYSIDNGINWQTSPVFSGLIAGDYNVSVQKFGAINKCTSYNVFPTPIKITEPAQGFNIVPGASKDISCPSGNNGTVAITIGGGRLAAVTDLYDMTWVGPLGSGFVSPPGNVGALATQTGLWKAGNYKATVTDGAGCIDTLSIAVKMPASWKVTTSAPVNVTTNGGSDGIFGLTSITGSVAPYTIRWFDKNGVADPAGDDLWLYNKLRAGVQSVTIIGSAPTSCDTTIVFSISEPGPLVVDPPTFTNVKCYADNTGSIQINIISGQPNYIFHIDANPIHNAPYVDDITQASGTILYNNLGAGTYDVTVTDAAGQDTTQRVTIIEPLQFQMVVDVSNVSDITCHGGNTGSVGVKIISTIPSGTTDLYPLVWTRPNGLYAPGSVGTVGALTLLTDSGTYIAHVDNGIGCTVPDISIKVREAKELVVTTTQNDSVTCFGGNNGVITVNVSGRPAGTPYTYSWSSSDPLFVPSNSPTIANLRAGWYRVTVEAPAPNLCPVTPADIWIGEPLQLAAVTTPIDIITCAGDNTGALNVVVTGGTPMYSLNIGSGMPSNDSISVTGLSAGIYSYTVTDDYGCPLVVLNDTITEPAPLVVSKILYNADCILPTSGTLQFDVLGGLNKGGLGSNQYNITLSNLEGTFSVANTVTVPLAGYSAAFNSLPMGHYTLEVADNYAVVSTKCPKFSTSFVLENIILTGTPTNATCAGVNTGSITGVTISGASASRTYLWSTLDGSGLDNSTLNQAGLSAGTYKLTVTDLGRGGCVVVDSFVVKYDRTLKIDGAVKDLTCFDSTDGAIGSIVVADATAPITYLWTGPSITAANKALPALVNLTNGTYQLTVTDDLTCSATRTFDVKIPTQIVYSLASTLDNCSPYGRSIAMTGPTGGTGAGAIPVYKYTWQGPISNLPSTKNLTGLNVGGTYTVTVKDENLCTVTTPITISGPMKVVQSPTQLACDGDSNGAIGITLTGGTGPFSYSWTSSVVGFVDPGTKDLSALQEGDYTLNVIDNGETDILLPNKCELDTVFTISAPDSIKIEYSKSDIVCAGKNMGAIHLTVSGGTAPYKVKWPNGYGSLFTPGNYVLDQDSLPAGTYLIEVEDFNKCKKNVSVDILDQTPLAFTLTKNDTNCSGIGGGLTVSGVTGGVAPYKYAWGGPSITATNPAVGFPLVATNLSGGAYAVTVTDANGCALSKSDTLTTALVLTYNKQNETCQGEFNGAINLSVTGGSGNYTYSWSGADGGLVVVGDQTKQDIGGLTAGTYTVVVTDTRPGPLGVVCTTSLVVNVGRNYTIALSKINTKSIYCFGANDGYIAITVAGGSGNYKYTWSGPSGFTVNVAKDSIYGCKPGGFTLDVEDLTLGCKFSQLFTLSGPTAPLLLSVDDSTNVKCVGDATGTIDVSVTGGTQFAPSPFYKYNWSGPGTLVQDSPTQTNLLAGDYQVSAVDANGCSTPSRNIKILEPPVKLKVSLDALGHVSAFGGNNGDIKVKVVGGVGSYSLVWSGLLYDNITPIIGLPLVDDLAHQVNLQSGHYNVLVTDDNSCTSSLNNIFISQPGGSLVLTATATDVAPCKGDLSGVVNADVYGGKLPYSIIWKSGPTPIGANGAGGESSLSIGSLAFGAYTVEVRDDNGNFETQTVNVGEPAALLLSANATPISCYLDATGSISVTLSGGKPNASSQYKLQVSGTTLVPDQLVTAGVVNIPNLRAGKYLIKLTDDSKVDGAFDQFDCAKSVTVDVLEPKASVVISDNSAICAGATGVVKLITSNWNFATPLTVTLNDGVTTSSHTVTSSPFLINVTPLATTTYTITSVSNGVGCNKGVFSGSATVTVHAKPTANIHNDSTLCLGEVAHAVVDFTGKAPFTYTYFESASATSTTVTLPANVYVATINASPLATSSYTVTSVVDGNCTSVAPSSLLTGVSKITVNPLPTATISGDAVICEGKNTNITFNIVGVTPQWEISYSATDTIAGVPNVVTLFKSVAASPFNVLVTPSRTTSYKLLSVKDANGCKQLIGSQQVVVTVKPKPSLVDVITGNPTVCQGARSVSYTITPVANTLSYVWSVPAGDTIVSGQGTTSILVNFPKSATDGPITVKAKNLCDSTQNQLFVATTKLLSAPNAPSGPPSSCQGSKGLVYSITPIVGATSYVWHLPAGYIINGSATGSSITVDLDPIITSMSGFISVSAVNSCGAGASSPTLSVAINPNPTANAGIDVNLCDNFTNLNATPAGALTVKWDILSGTGIIAAGSLGNPTASVTNLSPDENRFRWSVTSAAGCTVSDEVSIYNNKVAVNASSDKGTTCDGTAILTGTLLDSGSKPTTGQWSFVPGFGSGTIINGTTANATVSGLASGSNTLVYQITKNSCVSTSPNVVIVNDKPDVPVIQGSNLDICSSDTILRANAVGAGQTGIWSLGDIGGGVIVSPNSNITNVTNLSKGDNNFYYTITKNNHCTLRDSITVRNNMLDVTAGNDSTICDGTVMLLGSEIPTSAASGTTGSWSVTPGGSEIFNNSSSNTAMVSNLAANGNSLKWSINQRGCISSASINITNNQPTKAFVGANIAVCGDTALLTGNMPLGVYGGTGRWIGLTVGDDSFDAISSPTSIVRNLPMGANKILWVISKYACKSVDTLVVTNLKVPVDAGLDTAICGNEYTLKGSLLPKNYVGKWSGTGSFLPAAADKSNTIVTSLIRDRNVLAWTVTSLVNNCSSMDTVGITNNEPNSLATFGLETVYTTTYPMTAKTLVDPAEKGTWKLLSGTASISDPYNPKSLVTNLVTGSINVFEWRVDKHGCQLSEEITLRNANAIDANAGADKTICEDSVELNAVKPDYGFGRWSTNSGSIIKNTKNYKTWVTGLGSGDNVFTWTVTNGTSFSYDSIVVTSNKPTTPNAGSDRVACSSTFTLEGNTDNIIGTPTWYAVSGNAIIDSIHVGNTRVDSLSQGLNILMYKIEYKGCILSDTVNIKNNLPTTAFSGERDTIILCTDSIELHPNTPSFGIGSWFIAQGHATFEGNFAKKLGENLNKLVYVIEVKDINASCSSTDTLFVVNNKPAYANAGADRIVCVDTVSLSANKLPNGNVGKWTLLSGGGVVAPNSAYNAKVTGLGYGNNRFQWEVSKTALCTSTDEVVISNNFIQANAGSDVTICVDTLILAANNPDQGVGIWAVGGSQHQRFLDVNKENTVVRNLDKDVNTITWTIKTNGCSSVDTVKVTNNKPTNADAGPNRNVCDSSVVLSANAPSGAESGEWSGVGALGDSIYNAHITVPNLQFGPNIFTWTISKGTCKSVSDVEVSYNTIPASVGPPQTLCSANAILEANSPLPGVGTWSVVGGTSQAVFTNIHDANTTVSNLGQGTNKLQWSIGYKHCSSSAEVEITNALPSKPYAGNTQELCKDSTVLDAMPVDPLTGIGVGTWIRLSGKATIVEPNNPRSTVRGLMQGDNVFQWTVATDFCALSDRVLIKNYTPSNPMAGEDFSTCYDSVSLKAAAPEFGTGSWSIASGIGTGGNILTPSSPETKVSNLTPDATTFKWTVVRGNCKLEDFIVVTNNTPAKANAGPDIKDCKDFATLDANIPPDKLGKGYWHVVTSKGYLFKDTADAKTLISKLEFGENVLQWIIRKNGCFSSDTVIVFNKIPDQAKAGVDQVVCENYTTLNSNDPTSGIGSWSVMSGMGDFVDKAYHQSKVENIGFGENKYLWNIKYGSCSTSDTVRVVSNKAYADAGADNITYDGTFNLAANKEDNTPGSWRLVAGKGTFIDSTNFNTIVSGMRSGVNTFRWSITVDNCTAFDDVSITYKVMPNAAFITDINDGCSPLTVNFTNYTVGRDTTFLWNFDDGTPTTTMRHPTHTFVEPGMYNVTLTAAGPDGKNAVALEVIKVRPHPKAEFQASPETVYVPGDKVQFYNLSIDAVGYTWYFGYENNTSILHQPDYEYGKIGVYSVALAVKNIYGCSDSIFKADYITALKQGFISFPNAFSPRGDSNGSGGVSSINENAIFRPVYKDVDTYSLQIFNQWGQLIFSSTDLTDGWDGSFKGQVVAQGVYVWKVSAKLKSGKEIHDVGNVMVVR